MYIMLNAAWPGHNGTTPYLDQHTDTETRAVDSRPLHKCTYEHTYIPVIDIRATDSLVVGRAQTFLRFRVWPHNPIEESCPYRHPFSVKINTRNRQSSDSVGFAIERLCDIHCPLGGPTYCIDVYFFSVLAAIFAGRILFRRLGRLR
jgi:hypothetical protein